MRIKALANTCGRQCFVRELQMSLAVPPEHSSPVPRNAKLKKLEPRIAAARNSQDWTALSGLLQQYIADSGRESAGGSSRSSQFTTAYILARVDLLIFGERDGGLAEAVKFVNEMLPTTNDKMLQCIFGSVNWCAGAQVFASRYHHARDISLVTLCCRFQRSARCSFATCPPTGCITKRAMATTSPPKPAT